MHFKKACLATCSLQLQKLSRELKRLGRGNVTFEFCLSLTEAGRDLKTQKDRLLGDT